MANTQPEQKRKLSLPALIFIGMIAGILLGILFKTQGGV